jgi:hypothetical protein
LILAGEASIFDQISGVVKIWELSENIFSLVHRIKAFSKAKTQFSIQIVTLSKSATSGNE